MGIARKCHRGISGVRVGSWPLGASSFLNGLGARFSISVEGLIGTTIVTGTLRGFAACFGDG